MATNIVCAKNIPKSRNSNSNREDNAKSSEPTSTKGWICKEVYEKDNMDAVFKSEDLKKISIYDRTV